MTVRIDVTGDGRAWLWQELLDVTRSLGEFVLVGGLMVSLWARHAEVEMPRTTLDIDLLFRGEVVASDVTAAARALLARGYRLDEPIAVPEGQGIGHRFVRESVSIDLLVPQRGAAVPTTVPPLTAAPVPGGDHALRFREEVQLLVGERHGLVPIASVLGGLLVKARAAATDTSAASARHGQDLAVLLACLQDPAALPRMTARARRVLRSAIDRAETRVLDAASRQRAETAAALLRRALDRP